MLVVTVCLDQTDKEGLHSRAHPIGVEDVIIRAHVPIPSQLVLLFQCFIKTLPGEELQSGNSSGSEAVCQGSLVNFAARTGSGHRRAHNFGLDSVSEA